MDGRGHRRGVLPRVNRSLAAGLVLVAALGLVGLGPVGAAAGIGWGAGLGVLVLRGPARRFTVADRVTLARAVLAGCVAALVVDGLVGARAPVALLVVTAGVALVLDGVDGAVARRTGTASAWGARFDMETDAALLLVLSVHVATLLGPWVLVVGMARYLYVAAGVALPWLRGALPVRRSAKVVAAGQGIVLVVVSAQILPAPVAGAAVAGALAALLWSFAASVAHLWANR